MSSDKSIEQKTIEANEKAIAKFVRSRAVTEGMSRVEIDPIPVHQREFMTGTDGVREDCFKEIQELNPLFIQKITIMPMLYRAQCHLNTRLALEVLNQKEKKYEHILGYNITACRCGCFWSLELHSVIRVIATGEIFDLTRDFNFEESKWFVGMVVLDYNSRKEMIWKIKNIGKAEWFYNKDNHTCGKKYRHQHWQPHPDQVSVIGDMNELKERWIDLHNMLDMNVYII